MEVNDRLKLVLVRFYGKSFLCIIGLCIMHYTLLYFNLAVIPHVRETKMADVGKLISLGNLLVRNVTWFVLTTTSATLILSRDFRADCMTRIAYMYSRLSRTSFFSISTHRDNTLSYTATFRDNSHFPFWLSETTHTLSLSLSLLHLTSSSQPQEIYTLCNYFLPCSTIMDRLAPASKTTTEISSNHRKKQTPNMEEDTFLLTYIVKIL